MVPGRRSIPVRLAESHKRRDEGCEPNGSQLGFRFQLGFSSGKRPGGEDGRRASIFWPLRVQRSPDREASLARRREHGGAGALKATPSAIYSPPTAPPHPDQALSPGPTAMPSASSRPATRMGLRRAVPLLARQDRRNASVDQRPQSHQTPLSPQWACTLDKAEQPPWKRHLADDLH